MPEKTGALSQRLRERCQSHQWSGPHIFDSYVSYGSLSLWQGRKHLVGNVPEVSAESGFAYPPASEAQLQVTEKALGFPLPSTLRRLYAEVANGGFGPGYGILGVIGGAPPASEWYKHLAEGYWEHEPHMSVDLATLDKAQQPKQWFHLSTEEFEAAASAGLHPFYPWPDFLLPFCYWGCNTSHAIHAKTGQNYVVEVGFSFELWASSLEEWLESWLDETLEQE